MATIRERRWRGADGTERSAWIADFFDAQGVRRQKTFKRRKDADSWLVTARKQVQDGTFTAESTSATVGQAISLWLERAKAEGLERNTREQYRMQADKIRDLIDVKLKLAKLTRARCEQLRDDLLKAHSRDTARKVLATFRMIVKDAARRGLIAQNVAAETSIGANGRHKDKIRAGVDFPLPEQVKAMLAAADPKAKAAVALAALAGLRPSELRGLKWSSVDLGADPSVTVEQRADAWCDVGSPKSRSSRRTVPLDTAVPAIKAWKLAQAPGRALVFGTASDRPDMLGNLQRRLLDRVCAAAGAPRFTWHALRHYAVSSWLAAGIDPKTVQAWAGHATFAMTMDTYGHLIPRADDHARIRAAETLLA